MHIQSHIQSIDDLSTALKQQREQANSDLDQTTITNVLDIIQQIKSTDTIQTVLHRLESIIEVLALFAESGDSPQRVVCSNHCQELILYFQKIIEKAENAANLLNSCYQSNFFESNQLKKDQWSGRAVQLYSNLRQIFKEPLKQSHENIGMLEQLVNQTNENFLNTIFTTFDLTNDEAATFIHKVEMLHATFRPSNQEPELKTTSISCSIM